jgi:hypothetical protein
MMSEEFILKLAKYVIVVIIVLSVVILGYMRILDAQMIVSILSAVLGYLFGVSHNATLPGMGGVKTNAAVQPQQQNPFTQKNV